MQTAPAVRYPGDADPNAFRPGPYETPRPESPN